jgi:hypothetical protein
MVEHLAEKYRKDKSMGTRNDGQHDPKRKKIQD